METWLEKDEWKKVKERVSKGYKWKVQRAKRRNRKGRAFVGMVAGIRDGVGSWWLVGEEEEGIMTCRIGMGNEKWKIMGMYINRVIERKTKRLRE